MLANQALNYLASGKPPERIGNAHPNIVPYQVFPVADGHIIIAVGNDTSSPSCARSWGSRSSRGAVLRAAMPTGWQPCRAGRAISPR